ncbi:MAG: RNA-guided endonuclease InsQ/TnpB family protein [Nitrososphaeria archaeon]
MLSYRFRIYPSKAIEQKLGEHLDLCRWLYNQLLEELNRAKRENRKITQKDTQTFIVKLKEENPKLKQVYSKALQMVNYQLWSNIKVLAQLKKNGKKVGKLRFKGKGWFKTINFNQSGFKLEGKRLVLSKIGSIPIKVHREIEGETKGAVIKREGSGKWHAILQVEDEHKPLPRTNKAVGIDVGIRHFLTDSEGRQVENSKFYQKTLERIKVVQHRLSKKKKGSKNRQKQRIKLAKAYEKLTNQRNDLLHKLSSFYVNNYDVICVEDLQIRNMVRNRSSAGKMLDASWGKFLHMLSYKAARAGKMVVRVNPKDTSKEHAEIEDRDYRASLNILRRGLSGMGQPYAPAETESLLVFVPASSIIEAGSPFR